MQDYIEFFSKNDFSCFFLPEETIASEDSIIKSYREEENLVRAILDAVPTKNRKNYSPL